jgi:hypothetical protein
MPDALTQPVERRPTIPGLAAQATRLATAPDHRSPGYQRSGRQPVDDASPAGGRGGPQALPITRCPAPVARRADDSPAPHTAPRPRSLRLPGALETRGRIAAGQRLHLERLSAYAPELNPGEGLWAQLKDVERRHLCGFNLTHLPHERCDAVKRVRRTPRLIKSFFQGAKL